MLRPRRVPRHLRPPSNKASSTSLGTAYELHTLRFLSSPPLSLQGLLRVGGAGDKGVDLRGWWDVSLSHGGARALSEEGHEPLERSTRGTRYPVVVQCKAERSPLGPRTVRELEGVLGYERGGLTSTAAPSIALLVSLSGFSNAARVHVAASSAPMGLVHLPFHWEHHKKEQETEAEDEDAEAEISAVSISFNHPLRTLLGDELQLGFARSLNEHAR